MCGHQIEVINTLEARDHRQIPDDRRGAIREAGLRIILCTLVCSNRVHEPLEKRDRMSHLGTSHRHIPAGPERTSTVGVAHLLLQTVAGCVEQSYAFEVLVGRSYVAQAWLAGGGSQHRERTLANVFIENPGIPRKQRPYGRLHSPMVAEEGEVEEKAFGVLCSAAGLRYLQRGHCVQHTER